MQGVEAIEKTWEESPEKWERLVANTESQKLTKDVVQHMLMDLADAVKAINKFKEVIEDEFKDRFSM
jgi:hypothetical protein